MIRQILIRDFMGIALRELELPEQGAVLEGRNREGKTSTLKAIRAALAAQGVDASAIRKGSDSAEILIDLGDVTVRRAITRKGASLTVTKDGVRQASPQAFLTALLGMAPLDPLDLFLEGDPRKRRAKILSALPVAVSAEQLAQWIPPEFDVGLYLGRDKAGSPDLSGHGLEIVSKLHRAFYDARTAANREADQAVKALDVALARAAQVPEGIDSSTATVLLETLARDTAEASREWVALSERERAAKAAAERVASVAARARELRTKAAKVRADAPLAPTPAAFDNLMTAKREMEALIAEHELRVEQLREQLTAAELACDESRRCLRDIGSEQEALAACETAAHDAMDRVAELEAQATELEEAAGATVGAPSQEELAAAAKRVADLEHSQAETREALRHAEQRERERTAVNCAKLAADTLAARATKFDGVVKRLANDAPAALLAAAGGIDGLSLEGDEITIDGVSVERLSGQEQMKFAVQIARRLNGKSKLLVVDGLERLDSYDRDLFISLATADGFQLIATRVADSPLAVQGLGGAQ